MEPGSSRSIDGSEISWDERKLENLRQRREDALAMSEPWQQTSRTLHLRSIALSAAELDRDFAIETALAGGGLTAQVNSLGMLGERLGGDAEVFQMAHQVARETRGAKYRDALEYLIRFVARPHPQYAMELVREIPDEPDNFHKKIQLGVVGSLSGDIRAFQELRDLCVSTASSLGSEHQYLVMQEELQELVEDSVEIDFRFAEETLNMIPDGEYKNAAEECIARARVQGQERTSSLPDDKPFPRLSEKEIETLIEKARRREYTPRPRAKSLVDSESFSRLSEETTKMYVESLVRISEELRNPDILVEASYLAAQLDEGETKDGLLLRIAEAANPDVPRSTVQRQR